MTTQNSTLIFICCAKRLLPILALMVLNACASTKGYDGKTLPKDELAVIYSSDITEFDDGKLISLIESVNGIQVGDAFKGWPKKVEVKPGVVSMDLKYRQVSLLKSMAQGLGIGVGGAVGGAIAATADTPISQQMVFNGSVEKGKTYIIKLISPNSSSQNVEVRLDEIRSAEP